MKHLKTDTITISILLILAIFLGLVVLAPFILAIILGVMLKTIIEPIYSFLIKRKLGPKLAAFLLLFVLILFIAGPVTLVVTKAVNQGMTVATNLSQNDEFTLEGLSNKLYDWEPVQLVTESSKDLEGKLKKGLQSIQGFAGSMMLAKVGDLPGFILQAFIAFMVCFFLLVDGGNLKAKMKDKIPLDAALQKKIGENLKKTTVSSFWATFAAASSQSLIMCVGFLILGMPAVILAAGVTFISAWIPLVGSSPVWIAGAIFLGVKKMYVKMIILVGIGLFTGIVDNIIRSQVLKGRDNMHPAIGLLAIFGGISMFGIAGVFVGPVIATLIITLMDIWAGLFKKT